MKKKIFGIVAAVLIALVALVPTINGMQLDMEKMNDFEKEFGISNTAIYDSLDIPEDIYYVSDDYDLDNQSIEMVGYRSNHKLPLTSPWSYHAYDPVINKIRSGFPYGDAGGSAELIHLDGYYGEQKLTAWAYPPLGYVEVYRSLSHYGGFRPPKSSSYSFTFKYRQKGQMDLIGNENLWGPSMALGRVHFRFYLWDGETMSFDTGNVLVYRELCNGVTNGFPYDKTRYYSDSAALQKDVLYTFGAIGRAEVHAGAALAVRADGIHTVDWTGLEKLEIEWSNSPPNTPELSSPSNGASGVSTSPTLRWSCSDPDGEYDSLKYDVYLGTSSSPGLVKSGVTGTSYRASNLRGDTKYCWKIKAIDSKGSSKTSSVWSFTTKGDDNCCFPAGTKITMADGSYKNIEDINVGDKVLSYNIESKEFTSWKVKVLERPIVHIYNINNDLIKTSRDHPFYIRKQDGRTGWGAIEPLQNAFRIPGEILKIEVGDQLFTSDGKWITVTDIEYNPEAVQTYNILSYIGNKNYFANDLLVYEDYQTLSYLIRQAFQNSRNPLLYLLNFFRQRNYRFLP